MSMQPTKIYLRKDSDEFYITTEKIETNKSLRVYGTYEQLLAKNGRVKNSTRSYKVIDETKGT